MDYFFKLVIGFCEKIVLFSIGMSSIVINDTNKYGGSAVRRALGH